ncbi:MAG: cytidine deaminase [Chloroflexota bacterium]|nr:cytidine deaminase [Chloroflexota bacterium]
MSSNDTSRKDDRAGLSAERATQLMDAARDAAAQAYVPYSHFPVGAAVLTADGTVVAGCNIENASYPLTVCAERVAVASAVAAGHREIVACAVSAPKAAGTTPCGGCRQVLNEFKPRTGDLIVLLDDGAGLRQTPLAALLPDSFGPRDLERAASGDA